MRVILSVVAFADVGHTRESWWSFLLDIGVLTMASEGFEVDPHFCPIMVDEFGSAGFVVGRRFHLLVANSPVRTTHADPKCLVLHRGR